MDDDIGIEWLQNVSRDQAVIDSRVFVLLQLRELFLADIHCEGEEVLRLVTRLEEGQKTAHGGKVEKLANVKTLDRSRGRCGGIRKGTKHGKDCD